MKWTIVSGYVVVIILCVKRVMCFSSIPIYLEIRVPIFEHSNFWPSVPAERQRMSSQDKTGRMCESFSTCFALVSIMSHLLLVVAYYLNTGFSLGIGW